MQAAILATLCFGLFRASALEHAVSEQGYWESGLPFQNFQPGDEVPYSFKVPTVSGSFELNETHGYPLIIHVYLPEDANLRYMWNENNEETIGHFLDDSPDDVHFLFISYGANASHDVTTMRNTLNEVLLKRGLNSQEREAKLRKYHFALPPMSGISDEAANFIPYLMGQWASTRAVISVTNSIPGAREEHIERLDPPFGWLQAFVPPQGKYPLVALGDGCSGLPLKSIYGIAVVLRNSSNCSAVQIISNAEKANATAVLISSLEGKDVEPVGCEGKDCEIALNIYATSIPFKSAQKLQEEILTESLSGKNLEAEFNSEIGPGYYATVDHNHRLQEIGWPRFSSLQTFSWAAQWLSYRQNLDRRLDQEAYVVPIYEDTVMQGEHGIISEVELPQEIESFDRLELDFALGCPGRGDADCPIWDHVVQLFVCCGDEAACPGCDVTPWLHLRRPGEPEAQNWTTTDQNKRCGQELGRWVTPFRRSIGRWLTDVTPLKSFLKPGKCTFTTQTVPWALPWKPSLNLRFSQHSPAETMHINRDRSIHLYSYIEPLFRGGVFDQSYNERDALHVQTPPYTEKALLYATITGHGSDENNCAEFCPTTHIFKINSHEVETSFTDAGTEWNCTRHVLEGGIPNEHGTWQYGRGGWCDGMNVKPHIWDVTGFISNGGQQNTIEYRGLFNGTTPDPKQAPAGYIMMQSSLVFYTQWPSHIE